MVKLCDLKDELTGDFLSRQDAVSVQVVPPNLTGKLRYRSHPSFFLYYPPKCFILINGSHGKEYYMPLCGTCQEENATTRLGMEKTIGERIKKLRKVLKMTQSEFAEAMGISRSYITEIERGAKIPTEKILYLISRTFNVSLKWLKEGEGEIFLPKEGVEEVEFIAVPIITSVGAGGNIYTGDYELIQRSRLPHAKVKAFRVEGDSMEPTIKKGELVITDEEDKELVDGGVYLLAEPDNGLRVRRLRRIENEWWLFADNPTYPPERLTGQVIIIGRVQYKFRPAEIERVK